ncbi:MAG: hypothetical protein NUV86_02090 [Candidatus Scalindua sp.]|nr:hypothetical protein [Candidatus Scalindua sp.]
MEQIYEQCNWQCHGIYAPGQVNHSLRVTFMDKPGGQVLSWVSFYCTVDKKAAEFLAQHPRWSHDPTPLLLGIIQEVVWKVKILEVPMRKLYEQETGVKDINTGGITYVRIQARIIDEKMLQNWLLPVVNIANTHILDQIKHFYSNHPHLIPTGSTITELLEDALHKHEQKMGHDEIVRRNNLNSFVPANDGVRVFMDESGDVGFRKLISHYTIAAIIIHEKELDDFRKEILSVRSAIWGINPPNEIHYNKISRSNKKKVRRAFCNAIVNHNANVLCFSTLKTNYLMYLLRCHAEYRPQEEYPIDIALTEYIADPSVNITYNFLSLLLEEVVSHVSIENLRKGRNVIYSHDKKRNEWMNRAPNTGFKRGQENVQGFSLAYFGKDLSFSSSLDLPHSTDELLLWIPDWVANEVGKWPYGNDLSEELADLTDRFILIGYGDDGVKRGTSILGQSSKYEFPEIARDIRQLGGDSTLLQREDNS